MIGIIESHQVQLRGNVLADGRIKLAILSFQGWRVGYLEYATVLHSTAFHGNRSVAIMPTWKYS